MRCRVWKGIETSREVNSRLVDTYLIIIIEQLLLDNRNRENQVAGTDVVDDIEALDNLAEAGVHAVEVLGVLAVVADEELRAAGILATVGHRHYAAVVVLAWGRGLALDSPARTAGTIA